MAGMERCTRLQSLPSFACQILSRTTTRPPIWKVCYAEPKRIFADGSAYCHTACRPPEDIYHPALLPAESFMLATRSLFVGTTRRYSSLWPITIRTSRQSAQSQPRSPEGPGVVTKESCTTSLVVASGKSSVTAGMESSGSTCFW
jgi:hypothetical protein